MRDISPIDLFQQLTLALGLAFFFGLAFEDYYGRVKEARPGGVRTFPLLTLAGSVLYLLDPGRLLPLSAGLISVGAWLSIYYARRTSNRNAEDQPVFGLMVPVCNLIAFLLGPAAIAEPPWVPAGVTAGAVLLLTGRDRLHRFAREIDLSELVTAGKFLVLTGLVLPLLPDHAITQLTNITPKQAWLALVAVSGISYAGYLLQRYVMPKGGATALIAILGGLYSSTATAVALSRQAKANLIHDSEMQAGIFLSTSVMYLRVLAMIALFNPVLALHALGPLIGLSLLALALGGVRYRAAHSSGTRPTVPGAAANPLAMSTAVVFAALFVVVSVTTNWVQTHLGIGGVYALAGIVGFADIDPFVLNLAEGGTQEVSTATAGAAILLATASNNILKAIYSVFIAGRRAGGVSAAGLSFLAVITVALALWIGQI